MEVNIKIDVDRINELVEQEIVRQVMSNERFLKRSANMGLRDGVDKAVKAYIYAEKEEIIERVVDRASKEIVRKGLPKLLEGLK